MGVPPPPGFLTNKGSKGQVQVVGKAVNRGGGLRDGNTMRVQVYWTAKKRGYAQQITRHSKQPIGEERKGKGLEEKSYGGREQKQKGEIIFRALEMLH